MGTAAFLSGCAAPDFPNDAKLLYDAELLYDAKLLYDAELLFYRCWVSRSP